MAVDLRSLKQELEFEAKLERTTQPHSGGGRSLARSGSQIEVRTAGEPTAPTRAVETSRTGTSSAEYLVSEIKRHKRGAMIAFITLVISGISFGLYKLININNPVAPSFETMKIAKLSFTGKATNAAISLDGRYVVHTVDEGGEQSLWIRQVATLSTVKIVPPAEVVYRGATFSPDGDYVYYVMFERNNLVTTLYQVPVLGGTPRKVIVGVDSVVTFSPDGKRLAFVRNYADWEETALIVANADGTGEQKLATRKQPDSLKQGNAIGPAWSPDGKTIACVVRGFAGGSSDTVIEVEVEGGAEKSLTSQRWSNAGQVAWLGNGSGLIIAAAAEQSSGVSQLWYVSREGGRVNRVTNDPNSYQGVSLTKDFGTLATVQSERISDVWVSSMENSSRATQITSGSGKSAASWTSDGRIVYASNASGNDDVWMMNADGTDQKQLTTHPGADRHPSVCSGGRYVVFTYERAGSSNIWRMDLNGGNLKQLTNGRSERFPLCSPDGQWVIFQNGTGKGSASKVSIDGGNPVALSANDTRRPITSPDGKMIACVYREQQNQPWRIGVLPFEGGQAVKVFEVPRTVALPNLVRWTPDGRSIAYIATRGGVSNIWSQPLDEGSPKQLTDFKTDRIFSFDWSPDGKWLVLVRGTETSDVILIKEFR